MKRLLAVALLIGVAGTSLAVIRPRSVYSRPQLPSAAVLRRLNLTMAWRRVIPMDGAKDAILRILLDGKDMIVLTRSGQVVRLDAETGKLYWRQRVGKPYQLSPFVAANNRSVYVVASVHAYGLDRKTGTKKWENRIRQGVSASPVVDEQQLYVPRVDTRLDAFYLPFAGVGSDPATGATEGKGESLIYGKVDRSEELIPRPIWSEQTNIRLAFQPLMMRDSIFVVSPDGKAVAFSKTIAEAESGVTELYRFDTEEKIRVQPSQYGTDAFVGCDDAILYTLNLETGKLRWRHTAGTPITRSPVATAEDVFITSRDEGLARLSRKNGETQWKVRRGRKIVESNYEADRFLAVNKRFVYATDRAGRLLVLDRKRGTKLSMYDTTAWRFPVPNELTDRLYLAANDGTIVCLHDRDQAAPIRHRADLEAASSPTFKILEKKVTEKEIAAGVRLSEFLATLTKKHKIKTVVALEAFKRLDKADILAKMVTPPLWEDRKLADYIKRVLAQAEADYQVVEDTLLIVPGKPKPKK